LFVGGLFSFVGGLFSFVGDPFSFVGGSIPLVGDPFSFVGYVVTLVCPLLAFGQFGLTLVKIHKSLVAEYHPTQSRPKPRLRCPSPLRRGTRASSRLTGAGRLELFTDFGRVLADSPGLVPADTRRRVCVTADVPRRAPSSMLARFLAICGVCVGSRFHLACLGVLAPPLSLGTTQVTTHRARSPGSTNRADAAGLSGW
jgi:hypothetical protein